MISLYKNKQKKYCVFSLESFSDLFFQDPVLILDFHQVTSPSIRLGILLATIDVIKRRKHRPWLCDHGIHLQFAAMHDR